MGKRFKPSDFMKWRRPHLFSDSEVTEHATLDQTILEYHLETLTNRKQELDFEHFARKLAEKEICPNILPQTGPTGGGDSKVDSESYPVSSEISDRWYYADPQGHSAARERWAFAFSTKKRWRDKVTSDIKKISSTDRAYRVAYFITSRFVKDKDRSDVEDMLTKRHGIDVRILDRTWIVEKIVENGREHLAIETLRINVPLSAVPRKGPRDRSREAELHEIEAQMKDPDRYNGLDYQLVEDAIQAALLARGLGLPRTQVDGRLDRASRLAGKRGTRQQRLRCAYNRAWTYFWWYDDFRAFNQSYDAVQELAEASLQAVDVELLQNLWHLLYTSVNNGHIGAKEGKLRERTEMLKGALNRLEAERDRPNTVARARASRLLMRLNQAPENSSELTIVLNEFRDLLEQSSGLVDFPASQFIEVIMELGEALPSDRTFDEVFESLVEIARARESSVVSGRMLLKRATQKLTRGIPYEAIRLLGRAQQDLALHESRGDMAAALALCAAAYEQVGLFWAARATMLLGANQALKGFWEDGKISVQALACLRRLIWIELQLGRVPWVFAWIETFLALSSARKIDGDRQRSLEEEWMHLDTAIGFLFLKTPLLDLKRLSALPDVSETLQLEMSRMALLYTLGYEDRLLSEGYIPEEENDNAVMEFFRMWYQQTELDDLPDPEFLNKRTVTLHSDLLGCDITVTVSNENPALFLAEAVLAALEGFLATSLEAPLMPHTPRILIRFVARDFLDLPFEFEVLSGPSTVIEVRHQRDGPIFYNFDVTTDKIVELISTITAYIAEPPKDANKFFDTLLKAERGLDRALVALNTKVLAENILGDHPKIRVSDWKSENGELFPLKRTEVWNHGMSAVRTVPAKTSRPTPGTGEAPAELRDMRQTKHGDRKVVSLVNVDLWNKAGWSGTGYIISDDPESPPLLLFMYENPQEAMYIFEGWREELGSIDIDEKLRVSIITGVSRASPARYRIVISANPNYATLDQQKPIVIVSRVHTMNPEDSSNLDRFREDYKKKQRYIVIPAQPGPSGIRGWAPKLGIEKRELNVRPAWEIGEHDPDRVGIDTDDDVIIPAGLADVPVLRVLEGKKKQRNRQ